MPPDPAQPLLELPQRIGSELAATVAQIAPAAFALMAAAIMAVVVVNLVRRSF